MVATFDTHVLGALKQADEAHMREMVEVEDAIVFAACSIPSSTLHEDTAEPHHSTDPTPGCIKQGSSVGHRIDLPQNQPHPGPNT